MRSSNVVHPLATRLVRSPTFLLPVIS